MQSASQRRAARHDALARDVCQTLRIELVSDQLTRRGVTPDALGEAVRRVAQAVLRVSDLWFTLRSQTLQTTALEFVSLIDDTVDVWRAEDFLLVEGYSQIARWSDPDGLQAILTASARDSVNVC